jgi:antitoxin PrlF
MHSTLTSKGQLTLPKAARDLLQLVAGTRFSFEVIGDKLVLTPARVNALSVRGTLKSPHARPLSIAEMDEGISLAMHEKYGVPAPLAPNPSSPRSATTSATASATPVVKPARKATRKSK